jgi:hypothetical protein
MFLFEQTAAFIPDLFRALPDLECIPDQPGPRGRAFRSDAVCCRSSSGLTSAPRDVRRRNLAAQLRGYPKCKAQMMLVSIEPARARGVDLHTLQCAVCNQVLTTFAAFEDPMKSKGLGRYLLGDLHPPK